MINYLLNSATYQQRAILSFLLLRLKSSEKVGYNGHRLSKNKHLFLSGRRITTHATFKFFEWDTKLTQVLPHCSTLQLISQYLI